MYDVRLYVNPTTTALTYEPRRRKQLDREAGKIEDKMTDAQLRIDSPACHPKRFDESQEIRAENHSTRKRRVKTKMAAPQSFWVLDKLHSASMRWQIGSIQDED